MFCFLLFVFTMTVVYAVGADVRREEEPRLKRVERGWKNKDGDWVYLLADGSTRQETEQEIKKGESVDQGRRRTEVTEFLDYATILASHVDVRDPGEISRMEPNLCRIPIHPKSSPRLHVTKLV